MSVTAGGWAPPAWLAAIAAVALAVLAARHVRRARPGHDPQLGWPVTVEVVLLSTTGDGAIAYRVLTQHLDAGSDPDPAALAVSGLDQRVVAAGSVCHATSWRAAHGAGLVLTYTVVPDPSPASSVPLNEPSIVCSGDPLRPAPAGLHAHHIAAHGARHPAYLAQTDPTVRHAAAQAPEIWTLLSRTARAPVAAHDRAHALAGREPSRATAP